MPLININLIEGKPEAYLKKLGDIIHKTLIETWGIPIDDRFHIIHEHKKQHFQIDKIMWGTNRTDDLILLHIVSSPRTKDMKLNFYKKLAAALAQEINLGGDDLFINIVTSQPEDWSFANGEAQLLQD